MLALTAMRILSFFALVCALVVVPFVLFGEQLGDVLMRVEGDAPVIYGLTVSALLAADIVLPVPSSLVAIAAGAVLGALPGAVTVFIGLSVGCGIGHAIGARGGTPVAQKIAGDRDYLRLATLVSRYGWLALIACRPVPVLAEASVLVAGAAGLSFLSVMLSTAAANLGIAFLYAGFGAYALGEAPLPLLVLTSFALPVIIWTAAALWRRRVGHSSRKIIAGRAAAD